MIDKKKDIMTSLLNRFMEYEKFIGIDHDKQFEDMTSKEQLEIFNKYIMYQKLSKIRIPAKLIYSDGREEPINLPASQVFDINIKI